MSREGRKPRARPAENQIHVWHSGKRTKTRGYASGRTRANSFNRRKTAHSDRHGHKTLVAHDSHKVCTRIARNLHTNCTSGRALVHRFLCSRGGATRRERGGDLKPNATDHEMTNSASWHSYSAFVAKMARVAKPLPQRDLRSRAGERTRIGDVQLGNPLIRAQVLLWQWFTMRFLSGNVDYKWLASDHPSGHLLTSRWRLTKFVTNSL